MVKLLVMIVVLVVLCGVASAETIIVDDEGDGDFISLQEAVDYAEDGDTILVYSGEYTSVLINTSVVIEGVSEEYGVGADTGKPIIDAGGEGGADALKVISDNVIISNLHIRNSGFDGEAACLDLRTSYSTIKNNDITDCKYGIFLSYGPNYNVVENNRITYCEKGMLLSGMHNIIFNNSVSLSTTGITTTPSSSDTTIYLNSLFDNTFNAGETSDHVNHWDNGQLGNYWDDYVLYGGYDNDGDGIGDMPVYLQWEPNIIADYHPLMYPWHEPVVNLGTGEAFASIQEAIDDSDTVEGNVILVRNRVYDEHVVVDKPVILLADNQGFAAIDASGSGTALTIAVNDVLVVGVNVQNAEKGIEVLSRNNEIRESEIRENEIGIRVLNRRNTLISNDIHD
ncbi:MAG: NosD domain-containing protein, partial [Nanoarchaeota archaeon]